MEMGLLLEAGGETKEGGWVNDRIRGCYGTITKKDRL